MASHFPDRPDLPPLRRRPVPVPDDTAPVVGRTPGRGHRARPRRRLRVLAVALAVVGASAATWAPGAIDGTTTALAGSVREADARPVAKAKAAAPAAKASGAVRDRGKGRAARDSRPARKATTRTTEPRTASPVTGAGTSTEPTTAAPSEAAAPQTSGTATSPEVATPAADDGLAGTTFYGPNAGAARAAAQPGVAPADASLLAELARVPTATWLGQWSGDVAATVRSVVADARAAGGVPVFVAYNIPGRDCGGHSAGGESTPEGYARWIGQVAAGIGSADAVVVLEPDALAQLCGDTAQRLGMLRTAVGLLERNPGTRTYVDAGHSAWVDAATMAERLRTAGAAQADGFALNVSNFGTTASNIAYGEKVSAALGGAHFVIDTSRNGNGPGSDWCNPAGRAVGERPTTATGSALVDAFLWVKTPGESDGACNGGPAAGVFWPAYALGLMRAG